MLQLVSYLLRIRIYNAVRSHRSPGTILTSLLILAFCLVNVLLVVSVINLLNDNRGKISFDSMIIGFDSLILALTFTKVFFPVFTPYYPIFNKSDPITNTWKAIIEFIYNLLSPFFVTLSLCLILIFLFIPTYPAYFYIHTFYTLITASLFSLLLQVSFTLGVIQGRRVIAFVLLFVGLLYFSYGTDYYYVIYLLSLPLLLFIYRHFLVSGGVEDKSNGVSVKRLDNFSSLLYTTIWKTKTARTNLILALVFKAIFLTMAFSFNFSKDKELPGNLIKLVIASPLVYFTYVFNNLWGYFPAVYRQITQRRKVEFIFRTYVLSYLGVFLVDILLTTIILGIQFKNSLPVLPQLAVVYFVSAALLVYIGFISSINHPVEIMKSVDFSSFKSNTPLHFNLLSMTCVVGLSYLAKFKIGLIICLFPLFIVIFLYYHQIYLGKIKRDVKNIFNAI